jgi:demethylmenaquinone methyltransferase/2-methoxy-6-polyprenyl-1,4-benzoquinol methylase
MRYVDDPATTVRELARVVRPGGTIAGLEFGMPPNPAARALWRLYVGVGLPLAGRLISPGWRAVGDFLGPSIEQLWERLPLDRLLDLWREAGIEDVSFRRLSLGGGIVIWGSRRGTRGSPAELRSLASLASPADGGRPRAAPADVGRGGGKPLEDSDFEA